nr:hypothetical protein GCM10020093_094990 [Planobispora longispora]
MPLAGEISQDIREKFLSTSPVPDPDAWARQYLKWDDLRVRYRTCVERYGSAEDRVTYFRQLLSGKRPAFAHHALAMLMADGVLYGTALTTNFDKLLEHAFTEQGFKECQAIRAAEEIEFWNQEQDRNYVFKLHGDYDTHNILNTRMETYSINEYFVEPSRSLFRGRGLLIIGSAGNEDSVVDFIKRIVVSDDRRVLARRAVGVYVGEHMPPGISDEASAELVRDAVQDGAVNRQMVELLADANDRFRDRRPCSVFPVWGTGNFFLRLIDALDRPWLKRTAQLFLDHEMRLRSTFSAQGLSEAAIERHLSRLRQARRINGSVSGVEQPPKVAVTAVSPADGVEVRLVYGDISSSAMMTAPEFSGRIRAVVSPEDTSVSAGAVWPTRCCRGPVPGSSSTSSRSSPPSATAPPWRRPPATCRCTTSSTRRP